MTDKNEILGLIRKLAAQNGGKAPGYTAFATTTGIKKSQWRGKYWAAWGDALNEAGLAANQMQPALNKDDIIRHYLAACRKVGLLATEPHLMLYAQNAKGAPGKGSWAPQFGGMAGLRRAAKELADSGPEWTDIAHLFVDVKEDENSQPRKSEGADGWVYLLSGLAGYYKIGRGEDLERRVKQVSVAMPEKLKIEHAIRTDDPAGIEVYWHRRFADRRTNGEWFKLTRDDIRAFKKRKFQ